MEYFRVFALKSLIDPFCPHMNPTIIRVRAAGFARGPDPEGNGMEFPKKGSAKEIRPGYSGLEITNTELGDRVEAALATRLGWTPLVGALAGTVRQGAFDLIDENGMYVEVKAVSVHASEYKVKSGARANTRKMRYAQGHNIWAGTVMAIVEQRPNGKLKAWVYRREGIGCFRLGPTGAGWTFVGKVTV